jgi:hypothetical protein
LPEARNYSETNEQQPGTKGQGMSRLAIIREFWTFLRERKKFWLLPIIVMLLLLGALIVFTESSALSPFIYILF